MSFFIWLVSLGGVSERVLARLASANADHLLKCRHEDLPVTDLSGAGSALDGLDDAIDDGIVNGCFDLHFGEEVDHVFRAAVQLGVALLAPEALDFSHRHALHANGAKGFTYFVELEWLDDRSHHFHGHLQVRVVRCRVTAITRRTGSTARRQDGSAFGRDTSA